MRRLGVSLLLLASGCNLRINGKPVFGGGDAPSSTAPPAAAASGEPADPSRPPPRPIPPGARTLLDILPEPPKGCPSKQVLLTGLSVARGTGYYVIDKDPFGKIRGLGEPDERHMKRVEWTKAPAPFEDEDGKLAFLWGTWCAYPESKLVAAMLAEHRRAYTARHDISPAAEKRLHMRLIDERVMQNYRERCGKRPESPDADDLPLLLACNHFPDASFGAAWVAADAGDDTPLPAAAVTAACWRTEADARGTGYVRYRLCKLGHERTPRAAVITALDAWEDPVLAHLARRNYRAGAARLAELAPEVVRFERGYPKERRRFDDVLARLEREIVPRLDELRRGHRLVEAFGKKAAQGPGYVEGCQATLRARVAEQVARLVPRARGDALLEGLRDPVTAHLALALEMCHKTHGEHDQATVLAAMVRRHSAAYRGYHDALVHFMRAAYSDFEPPGRSAVGWSARAHGDQFGSGYGTGQVRALEPTRSGVIVHFKIDIVHGQAQECENDYKKPLRIDEHGNIIYKQKNCRWVKTTYDNTVPDILVSAAETARITPGVTIQFFHARSDARRKPWPSRLLAVQRGKDVIWAAGFTAGK